MPTAQRVGDHTEPSKPPAHPAEEIPALIAQAHTTYPYLDRVDVRAPRDKRPSPEALAEILDATGGELCPWALPFSVRIMVNNAPTRQQLKALALTCAGWPVCYFEPALARIYDNPAPPRRLNELYLGHLLTPWHGKHRIITDHDTVYFGQRRGGRGWRFPVIYADLTYKGTGEPNCFKFEPRLAGVAQVRAAVLGAATARDVTAADLLTFDIAAYCYKHERLAYIDPEELGRLANRNRADPYPDDRRFGHLILRRFGRTDQGHFSVQTFLDNYPHKKYRPWLIRIPLPEHNPDPIATAEPP